MSAENGQVLATLAADPERVDAVAPASVPALLGHLEALRARLELRMVTAAGNGTETAAPDGAGGDTRAAELAADGDRLITVSEAAERLGVADRWIYRRTDRLPFIRRLGERTIRCSVRGIERWLEDRGG